MIEGEDIARMNTGGGRSAGWDEPVKRTHPEHLLIGALILFAFAAGIAAFVRMN